MSRPLVKIALIASAVSVGSFLGAGSMLVAAPVSTFALADILSWDGFRERCVNELGDAGERPTVREFPWEGDDELRLNVPGTLRYRAGAGDSVEVREPAYLLGHLEIDGKDIRYDCSPSGRGVDVEIDLASDGIRKFPIRGSGDMVLEALNERRVEISIAGSGSVRATGEVNRLSLTIAGSGDVEMLTEPRDIETSIMGSGRVTGPSPAS